MSGDHAELKILVKFMLQQLRLWSNAYAFIRHPSVIDQGKCI